MKASSGPKRVRILARRPRTSADSSQSTPAWVALGIGFTGLAVFAKWTNFFHSDAWGFAALCLAIGVSVVLTVLASIAWPG